MAHETLWRQDPDRCDKHDHSSFFVSVMLKISCFPIAWATVFDALDAHSRNVNVALNRLNLAMDHDALQREKINSVHNCDDPERVAQIVEAKPFGQVCPLLDSAP